MELILRIWGSLYINGTFGKESQRNAFNILTLGESSTAGLWVKANESYPAQLEKILSEKEDNIRVIVPMHMGQNTAQIANRIEEYIKRYDPNLIVVMAGYNNEWSLAETNVDIIGFDGLTLKAASFFEQFRTYRLIRYMTLKLFNVGNKMDEYIFGGPEYVRYPPSKEIYDLALNHRKEFVEAWHKDMQAIIDACKSNGIPVILMTYHINPTYLASSEFEALASYNNITLIRNDIIFAQIIQEGKLDEYVFPADRWHPNQKGYEIIARNLASKIEQEKYLD